MLPWAGLLIIILYVCTYTRPASQPQVWLNTCTRNGWISCTLFRECSEHTWVFLQESPNIAVVHCGRVDRALLPADLLTAVNIMHYGSTHTDSAHCVHIYKHTTMKHIISSNIVLCSPDLPACLHFCKTWRFTKRKVELTAFICWSEISQQVRECLHSKERNN